MRAWTLDVESANVILQRNIVTFHAQRLNKSPCVKLQDKSFIEEAMREGIVLRLLIHVMRTSNDECDWVNAP
jgi:hypothetical protein